MSAERRLTVKPGANDDACPLCGIHRQNAGYVKESCGEDYLKPECFVQAAAAAAGVVPPVPPNKTSEA